MTGKTWTQQCVDAPAEQAEARRTEERIAARVVELLGGAERYHVQQPTGSVTVVIVPAAAADNATDILGRLKTDFGGIGLQACMSDEATGLGPGNGKGEGT